MAPAGPAVEAVDALRLSPGAASSEGPQRPRLSAGGTEEPKSSRWSRATKKTSLVLMSMAKVDLDNKIGAPLEGWHKEAAFILQAGIASSARPIRRSGDGSGHDDREALLGSFASPEAKLFERARAASGFPEARYAAAMGLQERQTEPSLRLVGSKMAAGKSGAFFFMSPDQQFIAKSCTAEEWATLLQILPAYVEHMESARRRAEARRRRFSGSDVHELAKRMRSLGGGREIWGFVETLLPRYLGLYAFTLGTTEAKAQKIRVLVMANVFAGSRKIDRRYDLKGSTLHRMASQKERSKRNPVYKDLDWMEHEPKLALSEFWRVELVKTLSLDVDFLMQQGLIDYSLLVGVHDHQKSADEKPEAMNVTIVEDKGRLCYLGLVDALTPYSWRKWAETLIFSRFACGADISCQPPKVYGQRLLCFAQHRVLGASE